MVNTITAEPRHTLDDLGQLAEQINEAHIEAEDSMSRGLGYAIHAGRLLVRAKALCKHGGWLTWCHENFHGTSRTCQGYMRLARSLSAGELNTQRVSHLPLRETLRLISKPPEVADSLTTPVAGPLTIPEANVLVIPPAEYADSPAESESASADETPYDPVVDLEDAIVPKPGYNLTKRFAKERVIAAIAQLTQIPPTNPGREEAFAHVEKWIRKAQRR